MVHAIWSWVLEGVDESHGIFDILRSDFNGGEGVVTERGLVIFIKGFLGV